MNENIYSTLTFFVDEWGDPGIGRVKSGTATFSFVAVFVCDADALRRETNQFQLTEYPNHRELKASEINLSDSHRFLAQLVKMRVAVYAHAYDKSKMTGFFHGRKASEIFYKHALDMLLADLVMGLQLDGEVHMVIDRRRQAFSHDRQHILVNLLDPRVRSSLSARCEDGVAFIEGPMQSGRIRRVLILTHESSMDPGLQAVDICAGAFGRFIERGDPAIVKILGDKLDYSRYPFYKDGKYGIPWCFRSVAALLRSSETKVKCHFDMETRPPNNMLL